LDFKDGQWQAWTDLMRLTQAGDQAAYARLLEETSPLILNYVRKRVFDPQYVEDVFQEVLLTFHKAKHSYRPERPFSPWFFAVIRNAIWAALDKNRRIREKELPLEDFPELALPEAAEPGLEDAVHQALKALPEGTRRAVEMLKIQGLTVEAAARELGISKIALKVRAHRGYNQLRRILKSKKAKP
jgi:RNA polymerase sigma-70 factor (ECF subfamily)